MTYRERGIEKSTYASDFENEIPHLGMLRYLKIQIQEPEAHGINRVAIVELRAAGSNVIQVQGIQESWVTGKTEALAAFIREREKVLTTTFQRYGLNLNTFLFVAALTVLPELTLPKRITFMVIVVLLLVAIYNLHQNFIPNALIRLSKSKPSWLERIGPQALSWLFTVGGTVVGAIIYGLLKGEISLSAWLH